METSRYNETGVLVCDMGKVRDRVDATGESPINQMELQNHVEHVAGYRHGVENYQELEKRADYIVAHFSSCGLNVRDQHFDFKGRRYRNIIATLPGVAPALPRLVVGAHYDAYWRTPGADDNASGIAILLETARALSNSLPPRTVEFVAFTLEEPQTFTHIIRRGSRFFAKNARKQGIQYEGAVILECVGFTAPTRQGGWALSCITGITIPDTADFLAVVANQPSRGFMQSFLRAAKDAVPMLKIAGYAAPAQGYLFPQVRFSDHSSFWEQDYPAIMLNDTVMFRNPHYHKPGDTPASLNIAFMKNVATAVAAFIGNYSR